MNFADQNGAPAVPVQENVLKNEAAVTTFTSAGGGIKLVKILPGPYAGRTEQALNDHSSSPIGALTQNGGVRETTVYQVRAVTDRSITYTATANGVEITKEWSMTDGKPGDGWGYLWNLKVTLRNTGTQRLPGSYGLFAGVIGAVHSTELGRTIASDWYADGSADEIHADKFDASSFLGFNSRAAVPEMTRQLKNLKWAGLHNQYYSLMISPAAVAEGGFTNLWSSRVWVEHDDPGRQHVKGWAMQTALEMPGTALEPGNTASWSGQIYTGPRSGTVLSNLGGDRREGMHYGMFRSLSNLFLWLLNTFHGWVGSFGVAIVMLTILVRVVIWPLSIKSTNSMKRMAKLAPLMQQLKEKHADDPQKMNMETMKLYREYGVNPVGGCLPVLLQFPIFLGYFGMMQNAVEMRGHPFLWVPDLSLPDTVAHIAGFPLNPLPLVMAVTMYLQMKVAPQPLQTNPQMEMQQKIFKIMPLFFLWFCYGTASALALYWSVQNLVSILQTWIAKRRPEPELVKVARRPSFLERAQAAAEAQQKAKAGRPAPGGGGKSVFKKGK
ncbi:MAG: membrane protein insertase YidC [Verrucomicrobiaceae bacterium]|nr:MAG: membrane protein insertase YidC [Verrucomicrobiaceae bacterium]